MAQDSEDIFIDAESQTYQDQTESYDTILIKQMQRCVDVLSMDRKSCSTVVRTRQGSESTIVKDIDEMIINSVDTFRILMLPFIDTNPLDNILNEIKDYVKDIGEKSIFLNNQGTIKIKDAILNEDHIIPIKIKKYKSDKYRLIFETLIKEYYTKKQLIQSFSIE